LITVLIIVLVAGLAILFAYLQKNTVDKFTEVETFAEEMRKINLGEEE